MRHLIVPSIALLAGIHVLSGCARFESDTGEPLEISSGDLSETPAALDEEASRELASVGFSDDEVKAVAESIALSKWLGVQSFVKEVNDGERTDDDSVRRESHGKAQGCLRARFDVSTARAAGVFKDGATYPAWIRLSNGGAYQKDDKSQHISRGMAIKLLGVQETETHTHDFLMITSPRFFIRDITHYPGFLKGTGNGRLGFLSNLLFNLSWEEKQVVVHRLSLKVSNLLESPEYSAVPYAYGNETVKFAVAPCGAPPPSTPTSHPPPSNASENYLEEAMNRTLQSSDPSTGVCYGFFIQRPRNASSDPIENPTRPWEGGFDQVATITIPYGQHKGGPSDYTKNEVECERMAFDPWNSAIENQPRGKTNWTRKFVYKALNHFRRVEMPVVYAKWLANRNDQSIPAEWRRELQKLRDPAALAPKPKDISEPTIDDGFRELGIVR